VNRIKSALLGLVTLWLAACSTTIQSSASYEKLDKQAKWVLLPIANNTSTPQAALSAEAMVDHLLRHNGITSLVSYPSALSRDTLFEPTERKVSDEAQKWAREQGAQFAVTGSVDEWRYKVGIDGEPAVGVTLKVIDLSNSRVVWSASGAKSGWSRQALSAVAQALLTDLLKTLQTAPVKAGT
jgi:TolB-like protein